MFVVMKVYMCGCGQATCLSSLPLSAVGEGADPQPHEARYHSQEDVVDQLRDEGGGLRDGAGLGCDEPRVEKADRALYENVTR